MNVWRKVEQLEARIAELEKQILPQVTITGNDPLIEKQLSQLAKLAKLQKATKEPIEGMVEREIAHDMEVVFSGKPAEELTESQRELKRLLKRQFVTTKPIATEYGNSWATAPTQAMELARLAKPTTFTREHDNLPVSTGYVPDDLRQS